jgi:hypothetical protein
MAKDRAISMNFNLGFFSEAISIVSDILIFISGKDK